MKCLLLSDDLMFGSQVIQAARQIKWEVDQVNSVDAWWTYLAAHPETRYLIVDLNTAQLEPTSLIRTAEMTALDPARHWLAIGPHVHRAKLEAARELGWQVLTRGQFHAEGNRILQEWSTADSARSLADR